MLVITLPLPHKNLSPNARCHHMAKARHTAKARSDGMYAAIDAMNEISGSNEASMPWEKATCAIRYYARRKSGRRPDPDNIVGWTKAYRDGLTDAGVWRDDRHVIVTVQEIGCDPKDPRIELEVMEAAS